MAFKSTCPTLAKVPDDEPIFVLRAQDITSPALVRSWLAMNPQISEERRKEGEVCAELMAKWPKRKRAD